jgi:hypothetical protein
VRLLTSIIEEIADLSLPLVVRRCTTTLVSVASSNAGIDRGHVIPFGETACGGQPDTTLFGVRSVKCVLIVAPIV